MACVTLQQIARRVGADHGTVSRVLNGKAARFRISEALAERVRGVARRLGYVPNVSARTVRSGRFNCAALLLSTVAAESWLPPKLLDGIHDEMAEADMHLVVAKMPDEGPGGEKTMPKALRTLMADGLIINYTHQMPPHLIAAVERRSLPAVWINTKRKSDAVYPNNRAAAREATRKLLEAGHRRIAYLDPWEPRRPGVHFSRIDRAAGYKEVMREAGLPPRELHADATPATAEGRERLILGILRRPDRPTAELCYWYHMMPSLFRAAAALGLSVPKDLSIVTFAGEAFEPADFRVSAMLEPEYEMGREAVRMLRTHIETAPAAMPSRALDFVWVDHGTCVRPVSVENGRRRAC